MKKSIFVESENKNKLQNPAPKDSNALSREHPGIYILRQIECDIERLKYEQISNEIALSLLRCSQEELLNMSNLNEWPDLKSTAKKEDSEEILNLEERQKNLEAAVKKAARALGKVKMTKRFASIGALFKRLTELSKNSNKKQNEMERLVEVESGISDALIRLGQIKHTKRFRLLQEIKRDFEMVFGGKPSN